ncbi:MAG: M23 family metallopeptidase [bacterium]|nr:M23 family metallopeptidase [bacterium]
MFYLKLTAFFLLTATAIIYGFSHFTGPTGVRAIPAKPEAAAEEEKKQTAPLFIAPLDRAEERITKKRFGDFITPDTSPVQPDKFTGFHAGVDWEIFPSEIKTDLPVKAVCSGRLRLKKWASGYGGMAVQQCELNNRPITVIYGHLKLNSVAADQGEYLKAGQTVGLLGDHLSRVTDGARKHLHLAFHQGEEINIKGYLESRDQLAEWLDPCPYVCR